MSLSCHVSRDRQHEDISTVCGNQSVPYICDDQPGVWVFLALCFSFCVSHRPVFRLCLCSWFLLFLVSDVSGDEHDLLRVLPPRHVDGHPPPRPQDNAPCLPLHVSGRRHHGDDVPEAVRELTPCLEALATD